MELLEAKDRWTLQVSEGRITRIHIDYCVGLDISDGNYTIEVMLETEFFISSDTGRYALMPGSSNTLSPIIDLFDLPLEEIIIAKTGDLTIVFEDGTKIIILPNARYEAWQMSLRGRWMLICAPGGSIAVFVDNASNHRGSG